MTPRLSVVIPTRDCAGLLPRALDSARALPLDALEIIVVDDGSTDATPDFLAAVAATDSRLVVIRRESDHGASAARNAGIARARAPMVGFLDADDVWVPEAMLARLHWHEANPDVAFSFCDHWTLLPDGGLEAPYSVYVGRFMRHVGTRSGMVRLGPRAFGLLCAENPVCTSGVLARRTALTACRGFDETLAQAEDWDLWIRLARLGPVAYSTGREVLHDRRAGSLSTDVAVRTACVRRVARRHLPAALLRDPAAALCGLASLLEAGGEFAHRERRNASALLLFAGAALLQPETRRLREAARAGAVAVGLR